MRIIERILAKTRKTETCWIWTGSVTNSGYGQIKIGNRKDPGGRRGKRVHRLLYEAIHGDISEDVVCCHKCDVRLCVNPDHIFLGTREDNQKDMASKGRAAKGERNGFSKLTEDQVKEIKSLLGKKMQKEIATKFGVRQNLISRISTGQIWRHVDV